MNPDAGPMRASASAPAEVLRTMVHELRQPLSSIETIAYYLTLILPGADEKVHAQLEEIRHLVEHANRILNTSVTLAPDTESVGETKLPPQSETAAAGRVQESPLRGSPVQGSPVQGSPVQGSIGPQPLGVTAA
jgi:hypothetical protein